MTFGRIELFNDIDQVAFKYNFLNFAVIQNFTGAGSQAQRENARSEVSHNAGTNIRSGEIAVAKTI